MPHQGESVYHRLDTIWRLQGEEIYQAWLEGKARHEQAATLAP